MRRGSALGAAGLLAASLALAACTDDAFCFADCAPTGGSGGSGGSGASAGAGGSGGSEGGTGGILLGGSGGSGGMDCGPLDTLENCGACGNKCELSAASALCVAGECVIDECVDGYYDVDGLASTGCEYACPVPVLSPEACDGIDNDCDGLVDQADPDVIPPPGVCVSTPGTPCELAVVVCEGADGWRCNYPPEVETVQGVLKTQESLCDGLDGNCDGDIDEWFVQLGSACDDGALGVCNDAGVVVCDPGNPLTVACDLSALPDGLLPSPEACNGLDDDCNGFVDDALDPAAFDLIQIPGSAVLIDAFESSRPDASAVEAGLLETVACSKAGVVPWTGGSFSEAEAACAARGSGFRLCDASELEAACRGGANSTYPYGGSYTPNSCNGVDAPFGGSLPGGTLAACVTTEGAFDLSGNVAEWTRTQTNVAVAPNRIFQLHGGSYLSPELGLACTIELAPRALEGTLLPNIGFRCCYE